MAESNLPKVPPSVKVRLDIAELAKYLMSGGILGVTYPGSSASEKVVFAFAGQPLPEVDPERLVAANESGLFVCNTKNNPPRWLGMGSLDELPWVLEGLEVGVSFPERFATHPETRGDLALATRFDFLYSQTHSISIQGRVEVDQRVEPQFSAEQFLAHFAKTEDGEPTRPRG